MTQYIKTFGGKILGSIETQSNGDGVAKNFAGQILGTYNAQQDTTLEFPSRLIIARGNILSHLVMKDAIRRGDAR